MSASMQDIANRANVSTMTVSRVMRGNSIGITDATRERVLEAARDLDYAPRQRVQRRRVLTHTIGVVPTFVDFELHSLDFMTYNGMAQTARRNNFNLLWVLRDVEHWLAASSDGRYSQQQTDGFIFISPTDGEWQATLEALVGNGIKSVVCYRRNALHGVAWVDPDNEKIASLALEHFRGLGHTRIGYIAQQTQTFARRTSASDTPARTFDDLAREKKLMDVAANSNGDLVVSTLHAVTQAFELQTDIVEQLDALGITAVLASDAVALKLTAILREAGRSVPKDLSVIGIDGSPEAVNAGMTTISFEYGQIGEFAVDAIIAQHKGASPIEASRVVPVHLVERNSTL